MKDKNQPPPFPLAPGWRIERDAHAYALAKRRKVKGKVEWLQVSWYPSVESLLRAFLRDHPRRVDKPLPEAIMEAVEAARKASAAIGRHLDPGI